MKMYEFRSRLAPEGFFNDLQEWAPNVGIACEIGRKRKRVKIWSKYTTFGRGEGIPLTVFCGHIRPSETGSHLQGHYRPAIFALVPLAGLIALTVIVTLDMIPAVFFFLLTVILYFIDWWDNASERRRVLRILQERYP